MSLIQWYKLDGDQTDSSGNDLHGIQWGTLSYTTGKIQQCGNFTGNGYIYQNTSQFSNNMNFSFSCWLNTTDIPSVNNGIMSFGWMPVMTIQTNGTVRVWWYSGSSYPGVSSTTYINDGNWHHIQFTRQNENVYLYVDGNLEQTLTTTISVIYSNLYIGVERNNGNKIFTGLIDDVRFYDHQLSTKEVKELQKQKVLHYKFDDFQEPTENISLTDGSINWWLSNLTGQVTRSTLIDNYKYRITSTTGGSFRMNFPDGILVDGKTYNLSYNYSIMDGGPDFGMTDWCDTTLFNTVTKQGFHSAQGMRQDYTSVYKFMDFNISQNTIVDIWNVQLEQKDHYTPYTSSSRQGTILDQSGYENNQELQLSSTPQWDSESQLGEGSYKYVKQNQQYITLPHSTINMPTLSNCTISFWRKKTESSGWLLLKGQSTQYYIMATASGTGNFYHANAGSSWSIYVDGVARSNPIDDTDWHHYVMRNVDLTTWTQLILNNYSTDWNYHGYIDDLRIYNTVLSEDDIEEIYLSRSSLDEIGNLKQPEFLETKHESLILDYTVWEDGQTGSITPFSCNGSTTENSRQLGLDPWGKETVIWIATPDQTSGADGGWDSSSFQIDNTKLYRFSTWIWRNKNGNGTTYLGCHGYGSTNGVLNRSNGQNNTNPYFYQTSAAPVQGQWELWVGHIWPQGSGTGSNHSDSGRYTIDGRIGDISADYVWRAESTSANHRSYLYYCTDITVRQHWVYPRVDICDGTEPSINELISGFDSNHIEYIRDKGGTSNLQLNIEKNSVYLGEASEVNISNGLIQWYPLNGDQEDYTPNRNNGTVYGATIATGIDGKLQYDFDGSNDYIDIGNTDEINQITGTTNITVSVWVYYDSYSSPAGQQYSVITCKSGWVWLLENPSNTFRFRITAGGSDVNVQDITTHSLNVWYHVVGTYDGTNMKIYVNGVLKNTKQQTGAIGGSSTSGKIGTYTGSTYNLDGKIQDVRIYNRQLTQQEVGIIYDLTKESQVAMKVTNTTTYVKSQFKEI